MSDMNFSSTHKLAYLFMLSTLAYGIGFLVLPHTAFFGTSSLYVTMVGINNSIVVFWAIACIISVVATLAGYRLASLLGFAVWAFAAICYALDGNWIVFVAVTIPNMLYWLWQHTH